MTKLIFNFISFIKVLLESVPELVPVYDEHIDDYDEVLEHVFMGDVTRFAVEIYKNDPDSKSLKLLLSLLDKAFSAKDPKLQELISVSFLENLPQDEECYSGFKRLLSEQLRKELTLYESN